MIFGSRETIAIEVGKTFIAPDGTRYIQFRFIIANQAFGDWNEPVLLSACVADLKAFLENRDFRKNEDARGLSANDVFALAFDRFYNYDYSSQPILRPNLRDRYHLNEIGQGAIRDRYGIVVVEIAPDSSRIIAKDLRTNEVVADHLMKSSDFVAIGNQFIDWAEGIISNNDSSGDNEMPRDGK